MQYDKVGRRLPAMSAQPVPEPGDVVISRLDGFPGNYAISVRPDPDQIVCVTYDEALTRAKEFARRQQVDVWVVENVRETALVARHRRRR